MRVGPGCDSCDWLLVRYFPRACQQGHFSSLPRQKFPTHLQLLATQRQMPADKTAGTSVYNQDPRQVRSVSPISFSIRSETGLVGRWSSEKRAELAVFMSQTRLDMQNLRKGPNLRPAALARSAMSEGFKVHF